MSKRIFDVVLSLFGLLILSPLLTMIAILVKWGSPGPIFYRGIRVGQHGKEFRIFKFRTMVVDAERIGGSSTPDDDTRITKIGKLLRKYKLDELPQLLNVISGEMSIVGPRPEVPTYAELYKGEERIVYTVKPGITDYASLWNSDEGAILQGAGSTAEAERRYLEQIRPEKVRLQMKYVREMSLTTDIKIILATLSKITSPSHD